ncbi:MAG TPA: uracil-DNA glycosylase [Candidatus Moranbacteria bacterium]|nr:uracil-DNA glycosylase [Candidatus Moranbacteria bacterium]
MKKKINSLREIEKETRVCTLCALKSTRTQVVPGEGLATAEIMFIGEGPGKNEDEQGRPFVGAAGKLLDQLIESISLKREDVYIANIVKCRPPNNRDPLPEEVATCWPWLEKQIFSIKPKLIIPLGRHSLARFLPNAQISSAHGKAMRTLFKPTANDLLSESPIKIVFFPCYHPAAALYNGSLREVLFKDFRKIPKVLELIEKEKQL